MSEKSVEASSESDSETEEDEYKPPRVKKTANSISKVIKQTHVKKRKTLKNKCHLCNKFFTNKGNLVSHVSKMHNNMGLKTGLTGSGIQETKRVIMQPKKKQIKCDVCDTEVNDKYSLKLHIRKAHYNLKSKIPPFELKKVNQVWFEKVINSDTVMELKKTGENVLIMRKLGPNTAIKVMDSYTPEIDLTNMYSTNKEKKGKKCPYCNKLLVHRNFKKHVEEKHLNLAKHKCNNCNAKFKRLYLYLKHVCFVNRMRKKKGDLIIIDS